MDVPSHNPLPPAMSRGSTAKRHLLVLFIHLAVLGALYARILSHEFVYFDDDGYVLNNAMVRSGLSLEGLHWAFTSLYMANWHPLTWLSYMADASLFGVEPWGYLLHNALLHGINSLLVYLLLLRLGRQWWPALLGSLLFLVHPLHVESVAWIAERKDVLSGLFYLLGLLLYDRWRQHGGVAGYLAVTLCCALALMAKPMAVTFPLVLVLFDVLLYRRPVVAATLEKTPLLLMCLGVGVATILAQGDGGAVSGLDVHSHWQRLANAALGYTTYLRQFFLPTGLSAYYPLPDAYAPGELITAALVALCLPVIALLSRRRYPLVALGVAFYLLTLLPVIGLLQVGTQAHADRYMYLPSLGLLLALLALPQVVGQQRWRMATGLALLMLAFYSALCFWQVGYWENRRAVFARIIAVNGPVYIAHVKLADDYRQRGRFERATEHAMMALALEPERVYAQVALGDIALDRGELALAEKYYMQAVANSVESPYLLNKVGVLWAQQGRREAARGLFQRALEITPEYYQAQRNLEKYGNNNQGSSQG